MGNMSIQARLVFSADCTAASTHSQAKIIQLMAVIATVFEIIQRLRKVVFPP